MGKAEGIRIFLRIRPLEKGLPRPMYGGLGHNSANNGSASTYDVDHTFDNSTVCFHMDRRAENDVVNNALEDYRFKFRRVFEPSSSQEEVFNTVAKDCVLSSLDGYNSTIFAYGQTGSGKTYSITGGTESYNDRGIIPRAIALIYDEISKRHDAAWSVAISYLQIYNDKGQDLLNHGEDARRLEDLPPVTVHETEDDVILKGLEQHGAPNTQEALNLLFLGDTNRLYCETPMNKTSSRSHCVFTLHIEARAHGSSVVRRSKLHLVDLAGSERVSKTGVSGTVLTEAKHINLSLHYLEQVIMALSEQASGRREHVPFRNSFMTMVLRDSLGVNCRTAMLATAHPMLDQMPETISTCRFAQRVALIRQEARVNEEVDPHLLVRKLKAELQQVRDQLAFYVKDGGGAPDRELSDDEKQRCAEMVNRFVADTEGGVRIDGFDGDLARIYYCFEVMKQMLSTSGGPRIDRSGSSASGGCSSSAPLTTGQIENNDVHAYRSRIDALEMSLRQKENEMNMLFDVMQKTHKSRFNAETQTGIIGDEVSRVAFSSPAISAQTERTTNSLNGTTTTTTTTTNSTNGTIRPLSAQRRAVCERLPPAAATAVDEFFRKQEQLQSSYDLSALTDAELLQDRTTAFEAFKRSYRQCAHVEENKRELKSRYESCKETARRLNEVVDQIKTIKGHIQRLRAERVLQGVDEVDDAERAMLDNLTARKTLYNELASDLKKQKETIDAMHLFMKRAQEQLTKDFEDWLQIRQKQLTLAIGNGSAQTPLRAQQEQQQQQQERQIQEQPQNAMKGFESPIAITTSSFTTVPTPHTVLHDPVAVPTSVTSSTSFPSELPPLRTGRENPLYPVSHPKSNISHNAAIHTNNFCNSSVGSLRLERPGGIEDIRPYPSTAPSSLCGLGGKPSPLVSGLSPVTSSSGGAPLLALRGPTIGAWTNSDRNNNVASLDAPNPFAPDHRSTGDAAADKQLAALYKARESMRMQFQ